MSTRLAGKLLVEQGKAVPSKDKAEEREKRLAAALRENLKRRKAQARAAPRPPEPGAD